MSSQPSTYKPGEVAERLDCSTDTVRRYSARFGHHLSLSANPGKGKARLYNADDIYILQTVKNLIEQGLKYDEIEEELKSLALPESVTLTNLEPDSPQLPAPMALMQQMASTLEHLAQQSEQTNRLSRQVDQLTAENAELGSEMKELRKQVGEIARVRSDQVAEGKRNRPWWKFWEQDREEEVIGENT